MDYDIQHQVKRLCSEYTGGFTVKHLYLQAKETAKALKGAQQTGTRQPALQKWLTENNYITERQAYEAVQELKHLKKHKTAGNIGLLYFVFGETLCNMQLCPNEENIGVILEAINEYRYLTIAEFDAVHLVLKLLLLRAVEQSLGGQLGTDHAIAQIRYGITGFAQLADVDFIALEEHISIVERILQQDPTGDYLCMTEESRKHYRNTVALLARAQRETEQSVAQRALASALHGDTPRERHIGYYILQNTTLTKRTATLGENVLLANLIVPLIIAFFLGALTGSYAVILLTYFPCFVPVKLIAEALAMKNTKGAFLPKMDMEKIENHPKTVLLVSMLLPAPSYSHELEKKLEQLYFCNRFPNIYICLLGDFKESKQTGTPEQLGALEAARRVIEKLNSKYEMHFMLFARAQVYDKDMDLFTGFERKRGAIGEFIDFTREKGGTSHTFVGDREVAKSLQYCIALDMDTKLLFHSAKELIATALHPLHRPFIDPTNGIVTEGYGILVPKLVSDLEDARPTVFSKVMEGSGGVTGYDMGTKDFYQDFFGESVFSGKGLLDIDAFHTLMDNRLPENQILSHDILEGAYLRTGFVSSIEMTDSNPDRPTPWLARLHRWTRGDWQNCLFLVKGFRLEDRNYYNPISKLSKYKLLDNLRRSLTPTFLFLSIVASIFLQFNEAAIVVSIVFLSIILSDLYTVSAAVFSHGWFSVSRKLFSKSLPLFSELVSKSFFQIVLLPARAFLAADGACRALYRTFISRKKLLEWVTSSEAATETLRLRQYILPQIAGLLILLFGKYWFIKVFGLLFSLIIPFVVLVSRPKKQRKNTLSTSEKEDLLGYNMAMWNYFEDFANKENNYLPPDNVQEAPAYAVANRTSPTNIGVMLLSALCARDFQFIDSEGLYERLDRTLTTIERLPKWHGNLYNWYDTVSLALLNPRFVSTVDSGNFVCCLVALKEGLKEYSGEDYRLSCLIERIKALIDATDLNVFFCQKRQLFSIGYDAEGDCLSSSHYDFLMSEARMTSYFAIAKGQVSKKHWGAMNRAMSKNGSYCGAVSWTGTMFEYFMPHMLLPVYEGSFLYESLKYCVYCQKKQTEKSIGVWGISESGYYAFDNHLNYQYKAHGVQSLGVKTGLNQDCVIAPYATFLTASLNPAACMFNLAQLKSLNAYGKYGFYEALDFTAQRLNGSDLAIVKSYMAHHIGMSMIASDNAIFENKMQKRFMRDNHMKSAKEFLQEKIPRSTMVYETVKEQPLPKNRENEPIDEEYTQIYPQAPKTVAYANGEMTAILTDTGVSYSAYGDILLTRKNKDFLVNPQGFYVFAQVGNVFLSAGKAPFYDENTTHRVQIKTDSMTYHGSKGNIHLHSTHSIHKSTSVQMIEVRIDNDATLKSPLDLLFYFEPILSSYEDYIAHPAYSKLFLQGEYHKESRTITFSRRNQYDSSDLFLTVGLLEDLDFAFELKRENLMFAPKGVLDLQGFADKNFDCKASQLDTCCAIKIKEQLAGKSNLQLTFLVSAAKTEQESVGNILGLRREYAKEDRAVSPVVQDTIEGRLAMHILSQLLFGKKDSRLGIAALEANHLPQSALWCTGMSGDVPIVMLEMDNNLDVQRLEAYIRLQKILKVSHIVFDLCVLFSSQQAPNAPAQILQVLQKEGVSDFLAIKGGIFSIDTENFNEDVINLIKAAASHISPKSMVMMTMPHQDYIPMKINPVSKALVPMENPIIVTGGAFFEDKFYVEKQSPLPYSHILTNGTFGTLMADKALGFTWSVNARENKITPWNNDTAADNTGEMILVQLGAEYFDVINGAQAIFSKNMTQYRGEFHGISSKVTVRVSDTGAVKYCDLTLRNNTDQDVRLMAAYYIEPVLGVNRDTAKYTSAQFRDNGFVLKNPYTEAVSGVAVLTASCKIDAYTTDRAGFFAGNLDGDDAVCGHDPCAAIAIKKELPPKREEQIRFILSFGAKEESAYAMAHMPPRPSDKLVNSIQIRTPDVHLNTLINHFLPHQILSSRLQGRTAFYQCGGAYGFRDQLQDICAYLYIDRDMAKRQIYRCCSAQFEEGDVLHWWHALPKSGGGIKGVRTRFSDDLVWLPYAVAHYIEKTGDRSVLEKSIAYLAAEPLGEGEQERYFAPQKSGTKASVYEHCVRALDRAYRLGDLGLVLIGTGDWNDGFSDVGKKGKGQSVWLSMFLAQVLEQFAPIAEGCGDNAFAQNCLQRADSLKKAVDAHAWDGKWYLRAFYDDGTKMGSAENSECSIDLLPQAFAVFAGMSDKERVQSALEEAEKRLVDREYQLIKLFDPPLQYSAQNPGYVKAYPGGIRENGGQYTHGAIWLAKALLQADKTDKGYELLQMLDPIHRAANPYLGAAYRTEPYYMAADIYTNSTAKGHGGWSLYTGAAAWYYRTVLEDLLGLCFHGDYLELAPNIPAHWEEFSVLANIEGTSLVLQVQRTGIKKLLCDDVPADSIPLDKKHHVIELNI